MKTLFCGAAVALLLTAGCSKSPAAPPAEKPTAEKPTESPKPTGETITLSGHTAQVPAGWTVEPPQNRMRIGQLRLPRVGDDTADGELTVTSIGGSIEANMTRWQGQFEGEAKVTRADRKVGQWNVAAVKIEGTFKLKRAPMAPGPGTPKPGYVLLGALVQTTRGPLIFKAWGPGSTMNAHEAAFTGFVDSLRSAE